MGLVAKALRDYANGIINQDKYIGHGVFMHKITRVIHISNSYNTSMWFVSDL